ncbi:MAG: hypothetical protein KJS92_04340 [Bacteroidetes bacterium]|nr:hypothetical protein [Bacteroidota bacterium]
MNTVIKYSFCLLLGSLGMNHSLHAQMFTRSATFNVQEATMITQFPGVQGSPVVETWTLTMKFKKATSFLADSAWAGGKADRLFLDREDGKEWTGKAAKGDVIRLTLHLYTSTAEPGTPGFEGSAGSIVCNPPMKHQGKILFRYGFNDLRYYFSQSAVTRQKPVYAP